MPAVKDGCIHKKGLETEGVKVEIAKVVLETVDVNDEMLTVKVEIAPVNHALSI